jgi:hypothetical protein
VILDAHRADAGGPRRSRFDVEFAEQGGEAPTPYEVLLLDAMRGDSARFTRQDGVEETWRIFEPLLREPPPVHPYAPGSWGPGRRRQLVAGVRQLARPVGAESQRSATGATENPASSVALPRRQQPQAPRRCAARWRARSSARSR